MTTRLPSWLISPLLLTVGATALPREASAERPYVVLRDEDGSFGKQSITPTTLRKRLIAAWDALGVERPDVFSVWTTFPMLGSQVGTFIDPMKNDVDGINIPKTSNSIFPDVTAILYHNDLTVLQERADIMRAPLEGFASYLFLLEFSHLWGPDILVPEPGADDLIGFDYHWSFFYESASPAGGNAWTDNGDGTFTIVPRAPKDVTFSPLDLYLMGLVPKTEVPPFHVLSQATVMGTVTDPLWGGAFAPHSFPWFDTVSTPLVVSATRRELTIDDVIQANGARNPAAGPSAKSEWRIGAVLMVGADESEAEVAEAEAVFAPIVNAYAPEYSRATSGKGSLVLTMFPDPSEGGSGGAGGAGGQASSGGSGEGGSGADDGESSGGCSWSTSPASPGGYWMLALLAVVVGRARRGRKA